MKFLVTFSCLAALLGLAQAGCPPGFAQAMLNKHNDYRINRHKAAPLALDGGISGWAQQWADHLAATMTFDHRHPNRYGENLYWIENAPGLHGEVPVIAWYNEISKYHWFLHEPDMRSFHEWGHFTQVVWKASRRMGVGCGYHGNRIVVVANYDPPGNYIGQFHQNV